MPGAQELTRRIKSVKSTRKVTRAMQMVSATKMRKAQNATLASRSFAGLAWELLRSLSTSDYQNPLLSVHHEAKKVGVVVISSNRGLVGSFNTSLLSKVGEFTKVDPEIMVEVVALGKKGREGSRRLGQQLLAEFPKSDATLDIQTVYALANFLTEKYATGQYKKIVLVYNEFVSTLVQKANIRTLLPLTIIEGEHIPPRLDYLYEPNSEVVIQHMLPRILESQLYQAILESDASEHSARMVMMKNATEAAGDLIDDLTLTFNQLRQSKITTELSEITAGRIALEN